MRILLLTAYFPPDTGSAAHLFYELGTALVTRGHEVTVITGMPGYHAQGSLEKYRGKSSVSETVNGMRVLRTATPQMPRQLMIGRAIWQFGSAFSFLSLALRQQEHDVAMVYSPPLPLGITAWMLRQRHGSPFVLNVQDLFPQSIIDLGLLKNPVIIRFFESMERFLYRRADAITVHSPGNRRHVISRSGRRERVFVVPNWVDTNFIRPGRRMNSLREQLSLNGAFVVSFAGVLGYSQDLDVVLEAARLLEKPSVSGPRASPNIRWLIVGDGVEKPRLESKSREMGLRSVYFLPMQPRHKYPSILEASDACLATLHAEVKTPVVPSKILSIMAAGRPVVAALDPVGDAAKLIEEARCGIRVPPENPLALADAVLKLYHDPTLGEALGRNGREYAEKYLSLDACVDRYEQILRELAHSSGS